MKINIAIYVIVLLIIWILASTYLFDLNEQKEKIHLITEANYIANSIDYKNIERLSGNAKDINSVSFVALNTQLRNIRISNKDCKFLYILGKKEDGNIFFFSDSQIINSEDFASPGLIYEEIPNASRKVILSSQKTIIGPITDRWGTVITAFIPIKDSSGKVIATLGMDKEVNNWKENILSNTILEVIMTFLILCLLFIYLYIKYKNKELQLVKSNLNTLNNTLTVQVKEEVEKNRLQDKQMLEQSEIAILEEVEKNKNFEYLLDATMEAIVISDENQIVIQVNHASSILFKEKDKSALLGKSIIEYVPEYELEKLQESLQHAYDEPREFDLKKSDGTIFPTLASGRDIVMNGEKVRVSIVLDLTQIKLQEKRIYEEVRVQEEFRLLASTDPLTGLYNRRFFMSMSKEILDLAKRNKTDTALLMLDIDKFKNVNDIYGHKVGDDVIITLALELQKISRKSDIVSRWGGEEFLMLLPDTNLDGALVISEKIRETIENLTINIEENKELKFTVSIGVSQVNLEMDNNIEKSIHRADEALYEAKENGRNKVCSHY